ncbi:MFS transporter [Glycomyces xiaoerkulensis]|uniref:MFS transporter n=1 Tax=Glycomyces xiaoerkulensis TaxID=2038139 RepID=UPI000C263082|nr:MFS transporter [Glycomyces xiaoerkulensis]
MERTTARANARTWLGLAVLLTPALLVSMDISILFVASPSITADLRPTAEQWLWMMDAYSLVVACLLVTMGGLGDRIGRRRLLMIGAAAFGAASLALAYAPGPEPFIAARVLLGIGAATLAPSTLALIRGMFADESQRRSAVASWTVAYSGGAVAGPILGGFLLEHFGWGSVFLINLPVMALLLIAAPMLIPESRDPEGAGFDLPGAALSLMAMFGIVFAVKRIADERADMVAGGSLLVGIGMLALFARRQRRAAHPLIDPALFRRPAFSGAAVTNVLVAVAMVGLGLLAFTFLQTVHGMSPLRAALVALPTFAGAAAGASLASALAGRIRPAVLVASGLLLGAIGMGVIAFADVGSSVVTTITGYTILTSGAGMVGTLANGLILTSAPPGRAGAAASISETGLQVGGAIGIAAFGTLASFVYRDRMERTGFERAPQATDTVGGAVAAADRLPPEQAAILLNEAFGAYTDGFTTVAAAGAATLAATAVFAAIVLRSVPAGGDRP